MIHPLPHAEASTRISPPAPVAGQPALQTHFLNDSRLFRIWVMHQADFQIGRASTWHQSDYSEERETCKNNPHSSTRMTPCRQLQSPGSPGSTVWRRTPRGHCFCGGPPRSSQGLVYSPACWVSGPSSNIWRQESFAAARSDLACKTCFLRKTDAAVKSRCDAGASATKSYIVEISTSKVFYKAPTFCMTPTCTRTDFICLPKPKTVAPSNILPLSQVVQHCSMMNLKISTARSLEPRDSSPGCQSWRGHESLWGARTVKGLSA